MKVRIEVEKEGKDEYTICWKVGENERNCRENIEDADEVLGVVAEILGEVTGYEVVYVGFVRDSDMTYRGYKILQGEELENIKERIYNSKTSKELAELIGEIFKNLAEKIKEVDKEIEKDRHVVVLELF